MSTFQYMKPGIGNVGSYQVSGIPFVTSSVAPALDVTSAVINFPRVTKYVVIKNTNETEVGLRVSFNNESVVDNTNYILLAKGESFSGELKTTDVHLMSDSVDNTVRFSIIAGLTNIERTEMSQTTPVPPNLLAWVQKQKFYHTRELGGNPDGDRLGFGLPGIAVTDDNSIVAVATYGDEGNGGTNAGAVYIFESDGSGYYQTQRLTASFQTDGTTPEVSPEGDRFGSSVAISSNGQILIISAYADEENGGNAGAAYVFISGSSGYYQAQKLTASLADGSPAGDFFGQSVTIDANGQYIAIGAHIEQIGGAIYIFESGSSGYTQIQKIEGPSTIYSAPANLGYRVLLTKDGNKLVAAARYEDQIDKPAIGTVKTYNKIAGLYQLEQTITGGFNNTLQNISNVAINEDASIIFAFSGQYETGFQNDNPPAPQPYEGAIFVFQSGSSGYTEIQRIDTTFVSTIGNVGSNFGYRLSCNSQGTELFASQWTSPQEGSNSGVVFIYRLNESNLYENVATLSPSDEYSPSEDRFGYEVILNGDTLFIAASYDEVSGSTAIQGSVYVFKYTRDY